MHLMTVQWVAVLTLVCSAVGCSSTSEETPGSSGATSSTVFGSPTQSKPGDDKPTGLLIEPGPAAMAGYRVGWASPIELSKGQKITSVTVLGDMVFVVEAPKNIVTAMNADNGETLWKTKLGSDLESLFKPSRDGEQIFIHSGSRIWTLRERDGKVTAVADLETSVGSSGVYSPLTRLLILSGSNGLVFAHSVDNNFARWRYSLANRITNPPVLVQQDVFIVDTGGTYAMLETATGGPLWRSRTLGPVRAAPAVQGSEVMVACEDGKLYAINRTTGKDTWTYLGAEQPLIASPVSLGRLIIQPLLPDGGLVAVNAINGSEEWRNNISGTPVIVRQQDMLLYTDNQLVSVDLDDGEVLNVSKTLPLMTVMPIDDDGSIMLVSPSGRLLRLNPL